MSGQRVKIEGQIYCLQHGAIHAETTDPYDYGDSIPDEICTPSEWRPVYWWARKGDDPS